MPLPVFPIAENMPDPVFLLRREDKTLIWMNAASENWVHKSSASVAGQGLSALSEGFTTLSESLVTAAQGQKTTRGHDMHISIKRLDYACIYTVFPCPEGVCVMVWPKQVGLGSGDGRRNEAVTMLGRMLAHELKNPLAGIRGAAQLLESELDNADDPELTELIKTEVDRISRLAETMEGFGSVEMSAPSSFNVHTILRKAKLLFQNQDMDGIVLQEDYDPSLPSVLADQDGLMQVVVNLLANAVEAIKGSGIGDRVEITTSYRAGVRRKAADGHSYSLPVNIQIIDNGPGIDEKLRARVFEPFVTAKANGHGLGLALVAKIVEDIGGLIEVQSVPGRTVFSVLLPTGES